MTVPLSAPKDRRRLPLFFFLSDATSEPRWFVPQRRNHLHLVTQVERPNVGRMGPRAAASLVVVADLVVLAGALALAGSLSPAYALFAGFVLIGLAATGLYALRFELHALDDVCWILAVVLGAAALTVPFALAIDDIESLSVVAVTTAAALLFGRAASHQIIRRLRTRRDLADPTLVVGSGPLAARLVQAMHDHPEYGLWPVGYVDATESEIDAPYLGDVRAVEDLVRNGTVRRVVVAFGTSADREVLSVMRFLANSGVAAYVVPRLFEVGLRVGGRGSDRLWGTPLQKLRRAPGQQFARYAKRAFDVTVASIGLVLVSPAMAAAVLAIRLDSPGPVLFRQVRIAQDGRPFELLKFRSMTVVDESEATWSAIGDLRQTRIGRILRKTSIDELPQLWNVVRNDMSLVGPRPERPLYVEQFSAELENYAHRHRVPVGITGLAQVSGLRGGATSISDRADFDNFYIENWSLWRDVTILLRTVTAVIRDAMPSSRTT